jgi:Flp pilus assembly protein TadD
MAAASEEARKLVQALVSGGVSVREAASVADMRGYRLYRRRAFGQARAWFRAAVSVDPDFELSLYNGARCAALLGDLGEARALLGRLRRLGTPVARARLELARTDPDLRALWSP